MQRSPTLARTERSRIPPEVTFPGPVGPGAGGRWIFADGARLRASPASGPRSVEGRRRVSFGAGRPQAESANRRWWFGPILSTWRFRGGGLGAGSWREARSLKSAVAYSRRGGESYWTAVGEGYAEWVLVEDAGAGPVADWEVHGAALRQAGESVEIVDGEALHACASGPCGVRLTRSPASFGSVIRCTTAVPSWSACRLHGLLALRDLTPCSSILVVGGCGNPGVSRSRQLSTRRGPGHLGSLTTARFRPSPLSARPLPFPPWRIPHEFPLYQALVVGP